jgi:hypothetical protein
MRVRIQQQPSSVGNPLTLRIPHPHTKSIITMVDEKQKKAAIKEGELLAAPQAACGASVLLRGIRVLAQQSSVAWSTAKPLHAPTSSSCNRP